MNKYRITLPEGGAIEQLRLQGIGLLERGGKPIEMELSESQIKSIKAHGAKVIKKTEKPAPEKGKE